MIVTWMLYAVLVGALAYGAAAALERTLQMASRPTRFVWMAALLAAVAFPLVRPMVSTRQGPTRPPDMPAVTGARAAGGPIQQATPTRMDEIRREARRLDGPLVAMWILASLFVLARTTMSVIVLWRRQRHWQERDLAGTPVLITPDHTGPAVVALPRERILIPEWALGLPAGELALVLHHEREHAAAHDTWLLLGAGAVLCLMPWNPALWRMRRRLVVAVEMDCDRRVLEAGHRPSEYGSLLLRMAGTRHAALTLAALAEPSTDLERRIEAMTTTRRPRRAHIASALSVLLAIVIACGIPAPDLIGGPGTPAAVAADRPMFDFQVEVPAHAAVDNNAPRYPAELRAANIQGTVIARLVVDTNGAADMTSLVILKSDHPEFTTAVREALPWMRFIPAKVGGRNVRQLIDMPFTFSLERGSLTNTVATRPVRPSAGAPRASSVPRRVETVTASRAAGDTTPPSADPKNTPPTYPNRLRAANIEGQVKASFVVRANGTVDETTIRIEKADHQLFAAAVSEAIPYLRFFPARVKGRAIDYRVTMPFVFSLAR